MELSSALTVDEIVRSRPLLTAQLYRRMGERRIYILMGQLDRPDARPVVAEAVVGLAGLRNRLAHEHPDAPEMRPRCAGHPRATRRTRCTRCRAALTPG